MTVPTTPLKSILSALGGTPVYNDGGTATMGRILLALGDDPPAVLGMAPLMKRWLAALGGAPIYSDNIAATLDKIAAAYGAASTVFLSIAGKLQAILEIVTAVGNDPSRVDWRRSDITWENTDITWETETYPPP